MEDAIKILKCQEQDEEFYDTLIFDKLVKSSGQRHSGLDPE
jgi:hypothetical protein